MTCSGEIVAAYAAGYISETQAIELAYCRGIAVSNLSRVGAMAAVGLGLEDAEKELQSLGYCHEITIACINSPSNVTVSGTETNIDDFVSRTVKKGIFVRKLHTDGNAYHSPLMEPCVEKYAQLLANVFIATPRARSGNVGCTMVSSLFGRTVTASEVYNADYWIQNLISPVRFKAALRVARELRTTPIIEIGPHSSMRSAIKETFTALGDQNLQYYSVLSRNHDSAKTFLTFLGDQFLAGYSAPLRKLAQLQAPQLDVLTDLPTYPWLHNKTLKPEHGVDEEYLARKSVRHELLGSLILPDSGTSHKWENVLRTKDVSWLQDHRLSDTVVFPAAAYISMAIEAYQQVDHHAIAAPDGIYLENLQFRRFLALESGSSAVRIFTEMKPQEISLTTNSNKRYEFRISSLNEDGTQTTLHASGLISISTPKPDDSLTCLSSVGKGDGSSQPSRIWYRALEREGLVFGPSFQRLDDINTHRAKTLRQATATVHQFVDEAKAAASPYLLHPTVIDAIFQLSIIALSAGSTEDLQAKVPDSISSMIIRPAQGTIDFESRAEASSAGVHNAQATADLFIADGTQPVIEMHGFHMTAYKKRTRDEQDSSDREALLQIVWKPDITALRHWDKSTVLECLKRLLPEYLEAFNTVSTAATAILLDLACHKSSIATDVLVIDLHNKLQVEPYQKLLRWTESSKRSSTLTFASWSVKNGVKYLNDPEKHTSNLDSNTTSRVTDRLFDIIVIADTICPATDDISNVRSLLKPSGRIFLTSAPHMSNALHSTGFSLLPLGLISDAKELSIIEAASTDADEEDPIKQSALVQQHHFYLIVS